jgi:hypothetical protein
MKSSKDQHPRACLLAAMVVLALLLEQAPSQTAVPSKEAIDTNWTVPNVGALPTTFCSNAMNDPMILFLFLGHFAAALT